DVYIGSLQAALQKTPKVLKAVGMHLAVNIAFRVVYYVVLVAKVIQTVVGREVIRVNRASCFDVSANLRLKQVPLSIANCRCSHFTAAFKDAKSRRLSFHSASGNQFRPSVGVHETGCAADKSLINFDFLSFAAKLDSMLFMECESNAVHHEPSRLLRDAESA